MRASILDRPTPTSPSRQPPTHGHLEGRFSRRVERDADLPTVARGLSPDRVPTQGLPPWAGHDADEDGSVTV